ncbi:MAG: ferritin-like domain-containing protein [Acidimicrobiia bacterium]
MNIDERRLTELIEESKDGQADAMAAARASLPVLEELAHERTVPEPGRPRLRPAPSPLAQQGAGAGTSGFGRTGRGMGLGLVAGGFGALLAALVARPAGADEAADIQMLQTATSLELLAVATYEAALGLPFIKDGNKVVVAFAQTTMMQHGEHAKAFQAQTTALGGKPQTQPNPTFSSVVEQAKPSLSAPLDVVKLAAQLEKVATDTYLTNLTELDSTTAKEVMGSVMGVESQHLAVLRAVQALLEAGAPQFIAIPVDLANLPAAAGSVAFPKAFEETPADFVADKKTGAVK